MPKFHITIIEEPDQIGGDLPLASIDRLSMCVDVLDLAAVTRLLTTPPRRPRSDKGKPRPETK